MFEYAEFDKVAVLMGGISAEREISLASGMAVLNALQSSGVDAHKVDATPDNINQLQEQGFARAFIVLHGQWGEDGVVQGALQAIGMPYTGSGVLGCALSMDKVRCKQIWQTLALPTAAYRVLNSEADLTELVAQLGLPLFIKPATQGSSIGISKVTEPNALRDAYHHGAQYSDTVLAEQFLSGAELTVGILNDQALPVVRMASANEFYDYEAKYHSNQTQYFCPAGISDDLEQHVKQLALEAFKAVACSSWGRVDLMLDSTGQPQLVEVNAVPGMTDHSLVPMAAQAVGISFAQLVLQILATTLASDDINIRGQR